MIFRLPITALCFLCGITMGEGQGQPRESSGLEYSFTGHYGQVEVGGRYAGAEFHDSRPLPSRISLYYPVANSIDLSTDYWKRGESRPMAVGIQIGSDKRRWIGREPWSYTVSPHKVVFWRKEDTLEYSMKYEFCLNEPAMVFTFAVRNLSPRPQTATLYVHLKTVLRTCQTYARKDTARTSFDRTLNMMRFDFDDSEVGRASVFLENVGLQPSTWASDAAEISATDSGTSMWISSATGFPGAQRMDRRHSPVAAFEYQREINPGDSMKVIQVVGSGRQSEVTGIAQRISSSWEREVKAYDELIRQESEERTEFKTNDPALDMTAVWAKGILTANAHYIDSRIVPMPCPAEYNFFFTHDMLMTDIGAVNFDVARVKRDLLYIASLSKDEIIPHAYYWRDSAFTREYCTPDNWNHFWFILVTGAYLRHSLDTTTVSALYPLVTKSLEEVLTQLKSDNLMYAFRPDWWDMGHVEGPRAYMTSLAIRSVREYLFIASFLHQRAQRLNEYEALADSMQHALSCRLWDDQMKYLINYNEGRKDEHYYMGSLLAVAYGLLDAEKAKLLVKTASEKLLDGKIGVRTAMPPDFHTEKAIQLYKFAGEEAGKPYFYANGGVWPHDNAWYAMALNEVGKADEAAQFLKKAMTLDGIIHSPSGQPAFYEYRYADPASKEYGKVDKPCFLWAGGFYLKTLYELFGARENEWNLSFRGPIPTAYPSARYTFAVGNSKEVTVSNSGMYLESLLIGEVSIPSLVLPVEDMQGAKTVTVTFGSLQRPYIKSVNAILMRVRRDGLQGITCQVASFPGHTISLVIVAPAMVKRAELDGVLISNVRTVKKYDVSFEHEIEFTGTEAKQNLHIQF